MRLHKGITTALGSGYSPIAPGTAGSVLGILLMYGFNWTLQYLGCSTICITLTNAVVISFVMILGVWSIKNMHKVWSHDDQRIVIDEVVGVWITAFAIPLHWYTYLAALILFRLFDIFKPLGIRKIDRSNSNWSVMLDDIVAGIYAWIVLWGIIFIYFQF